MSFKSVRVMLLF